MSSVIHNILPVFAVIALGNVLGRRGFVPPSFFSAADRMVYFVFFPVMLFWKIGAAGETALDLPLLGATLGAVACAFFASLLYMRITGMDPYLAGSFAQLSFRFNTYIGLAVILSLLGDPGVAWFGVIISVNIPVINVLAVGVLIWHGEGEYSPGQKTVLVLKAMLANPLIIACLLGLAWGATKIPFPPFFENTFRLLSVAALPLALLSIGNALTLTVLRGHFNRALAGAVIRLLLMPAAGWLLLQYLHVDGLRFQAAMVYLTLPTSASAYILSAQLGSDPEFASAGIVLSTFLSFITLSLAAIWFIPA